MAPVQKQILSPSYPNGINSGLTYMGPVDWAFVLLKTWGLPSSNYCWQIKKKKNRGYVMIWFISYTHQTQAIGKARKQHARGSSEPAFTHISNHPLFASQPPLKFLPRLEFPGSDQLCFYLSFSSAPSLSCFPCVKSTRKEPAPGQLRGTGRTRSLVDQVLFGKSCHLDFTRFTCMLRHKDVTYLHFPLLSEVAQ